MTHTVPEIRYDHMTDRALLDADSARRLFDLSASWAGGLSPLKRRGWRAMARLRAAAATHEPFPLVRVLGRPRARKSVIPCFSSCMAACLS